MSGALRNIDPPPTPLTARRVWCGGRTHSLGGEGVGGYSSKDARHCSVLYICKYFLGVCDYLQRGCPEVLI
jgi:hypothetical protein